MKKELFIHSQYKKLKWFENLDKITDLCIRKYERLIDYLSIEKDKKNISYVQNKKILDRIDTFKY